MNDSWQPEKLQSEIFKDFNAFVSIQELTDFPDIDWFNKHFVLTSFEFIAQNKASDFEGLYYEQIINKHQKIPTRLCNWHDLFNAFIWSVFPKTKQLINKLHVADINDYGMRERSKRRNALTLFDECGIILAYSDEQQKQLLRNHQWQEMFWQRRSDWFSSIQPFIFGHANYEMSLNRFIGLTGKAYFIKVNNEFFSLPLTEQYKFLDKQLSDEIEKKQTLNDNSRLSPLPFLGIPDWHTDNNNQRFYSNKEYFRPKNINSKK